MLYLGLVACSLVWGSTFFIVKDALAGIDPIVLIAYRFLFAAAALLPWIYIRRNEFMVRPVLKESSILALLLIILYIFQCVGLLWTSAANSGFITGLFVLFVPILGAIFFKHRLSVLQWASVALALFGLWVLTGGVTYLNIGDTLTLLGAVASGAHILFIDRFVNKNADPVVLCFQQFWMTGLFCLLLAVGLGRPFEVADNLWKVIIYLALFPTAFAILMQSYAQKQISPFKASLIFSLEPVFAAMFAWTLGGEPFTLYAATGGTIMVAAMILAELKPNG